MGQVEREIGELIDDIANKRHGGLRFPVMSGAVVAGSVDMTNGVCTVQLSTEDADSAGTSGVLLNAVSLNTNGFVLYPADDSQVWVAEIDGPGKWGLVKCSDLVKASLVIGDSSITVTNGLIQLNGGSNNGLVNGAAVKTKLNNIETKVNGLITAINGWTPVSMDGGASLKTVALMGWLTSSLALTAESDIEETGVKH